MTEPPFVPRERLLKKQQYFQSIKNKPTFLKGRYDMIFSVAIPLAFAVTCGTLIVRGVYNMAIGKKD